MTFPLCACVVLLVPENTRRGAEDVRQAASCEKSPQHIGLPPKEKRATTPWPALQVTPAG
jgi:hypothetical protein